MRVEIRILGTENRSLKVHLGGNAVEKAGASEI